MVDLSFISARFLGTDHADKGFASPGEDDPVDLGINPAEGNEANLAVVFPVVDPLHDFVGKDLSSGQKRDAMSVEIDPGFIFVPLELQFHASHRLK